VGDSGGVHLHRACVCVMFCFVCVLCCPARVAALSLGVTVCGPATAEQPAVHALVVSLDNRQPPLSASSWSLRCQQPGVAWAFILCVELASNSIQHQLQWLFMQHIVAPSGWQLGPDHASVGGGLCGWSRGAAAAT
jgi:hypothetical protein